MYVVVSKAEKHVLNGELVGTNERTSLRPRCRTNRGLYNQFNCTFGACPLGFQLRTVMPKDVRGRIKHVACNVRFNKTVVFHDNIEIITNMGSLFTW
jgi:hypothetical protein